MTGLLVGCGGSADATDDTGTPPGAGGTANDAGGTGADGPIEDDGATSGLDASEDHASEDHEATDAGATDGGGGGASDDAAALDAGSDAAADPGLELGAPIDVAPADLEKWIWIPIESMRCADDSPAGIGVNFTNKSRKLVFWFQGNGVCYDLKSCTIFKDLLVGMGPDPIDHLFWGKQNALYGGIFDRNDPSNPFRDDNYVALPHCAIDGHSADKESTYPPLPTYYQHGYRNVKRALERVVPTFTDATRILVAGFSAGGIGTTANYHQVADAFQAVGGPLPYLINDAGPLLRKPYLSDRANQSVRDGWGLKDTIEPWCPDCATEGYGAVFRTLQKLHPGLRSSLVNAYADATVSQLYGMLTFDPMYLLGTQLKTGLVEFSKYSQSIQGSMAPSVQREFYYEGDRHGATVLRWTDTPGLLDFVKAQLDGSPTWASVVP